MHTNGLSTSVKMHEEAILQLGYKSKIQQHAYLFLVVVSFLIIAWYTREKEKT